MELEEERGWDVPEFLAIPGWSPLEPTAWLWLRDEEAVRDWVRALAVVLGKLPVFTAATSLADASSDPAIDLTNFLIRATGTERSRQSLNLSRASSLNRSDSLRRLREDPMGPQSLNWALIWRQASQPNQASHLGPRPALQILDFDRGELPGGGAQVEARPRRPRERKRRRGTAPRPSQSLPGSETELGPGGRRSRRSSATRFGSFPPQARLSPDKWQPREQPSDGAARRRFTN